MTTQEEHKQRSQQPLRCIIIGAGIAGLSAATTLLERAPGRVEVCVLEASDRVGGRCCSTFDDRVGWEQGATWIHGIGDRSNPNPIYALAQRHGLLPTEPVKGTLETQVDAPQRAHSATVADPLGAAARRPAADAGAAARGQHRVQSV